MKNLFPFLFYLRQGFYKKTCLIFQILKKATFLRYILFDFCTFCCRSNTGFTWDKTLTTVELLRNVFNTCIKTTLFVFVRIFKVFYVFLFDT